MNIPKKIHYFWTGNKISQNDLKNIMAIKAENPGFQLNIWGNKTDESLIIKTFNSLTFTGEEGKNSKNYHLGFTQTKFSYVYRIVETAFDFLFHTIMRGQPNNSSAIAQENIVGGDRELVRYLRHLYYFNLQGTFRNYAASSDIARLVILYMEGGIYLDVDVQLRTQLDDQPGVKHRKKISLDITNNRFDAIKLNSDLGFGDASGCGWGPGNTKNKFGNAIIASQPQSDSILQLLLHMARQIKRSHLLRQVGESPYGNEISSAAKTLRVDKLNYALDYENTERKNIIPNKSCGILAPEWRTGIDLTKENSDQKRRKRRLEHTVNQTGPIFYRHHFRIKNTNLMADELKIQIEGKDKGMFSAVNAEANWANSQKRNNKK
ncbi:glycosyltransferase [Xenorhabdus bharatensis]|uniref:glycosyltransferase n=1 Tax=Xenorhabdus bharatensis TaxID=3136256 RepID=UPI0030F3B5F8